jgi:hypothetical protein
VLRHLTEAIIAFQKVRGVNKYYLWINPKLFFLPSSLRAPAARRMKLKYAISRKIKES